MKVLFATNNPSKLKLYKNMFKGTDYEILGLKDLNIVHDVVEDGNNPKENALKKAKEYQEISNMVTISDDTGLYLDGLPNDEQPGTHVRRMGERTLTDDEMIERYTQIASRNGGHINGKWTKSIAIVDTNKNEYTFDYNVEKIFTEKVLNKRHEGFPLDSISIAPEFNKYTIELTDEENKTLLKLNNEKMYNYVIGILDKISKQ